MNEKRKMPGAALAACVTRARIFAAMAVVVASTVGLVGCGGGDGRPNVLLITIDTMRPDHLGFGGATHPTSPALDELARGGLVFSRAYSQSGWTIPSIASVLTGRYPGGTGRPTFTGRSTPPCARYPAFFVAKGMIRRAL